MERGGKCEPGDKAVLYFDVTSIKFGFDDENDFYRKGDAMAAMACALMPLGAWRVMA